MFVINCDYVNYPGDPGYLWQVDPTAADPTAGNATPIGDPHTDVTCAAQGTYQASSGTSFFFDNNDYYLWNPNLEDGVFTEAFPDSYNSPSALASDTDGNFYVLNWHSTPPFGYRLATMDSTGTITEVNPTINVSNTKDFSNYGALAINPVDGKLYTFNRSGGDLQIWTIDLVTGNYVDTGIVVAESGLGFESDPTAMAIDENGIAWVTDDATSTGSGLVAIDLATGDAWLISQGFYDATSTVLPSHGSFNTMSIWIVPPASSGGGSNSGGSAALANTGNSDVVVWAAIFSSALIASGFLLLKRRRS